MVIKKPHTRGTAPLTFSLQQLAAVVTLTCVVFAVARFAPVATICGVPVIFCLYVTAATRWGRKGVPYRSATVVSLLVYAASLYQVAVGFITLFVQAGWLFWYASDRTLSTGGRIVVVILTSVVGAGVMVLYYLASEAGG